MYMCVHTSQPVSSDDDIGKSPTGSDQLSIDQKTKEC